MKNVVKNSFYSVVAISLIGLSAVNAIDVKGTKDTTTWDNATDGWFINTLDKMLWYLIGLLYFVAVAYALYGWFMILTAGWEEDRVKKGKTTLINAIIGLIVIFLASQIVNWIIGLSTTVIN